MEGPITGIVTDTTNKGLELLLNAYAWIRSAGQSSGSSDVNAVQPGVFFGFSAGA